MYVDLDLSISGTCLSRLVNGNNYIITLETLNMKLVVHLKKKKNTSKLLRPTRPQGYVIAFLLHYLHDKEAGNTHHKISWDSRLMHKYTLTDRN